MIDVSDLTAWEHDLEKVAVTVVPKMEAIVTKGALNVKNGARDLAKQIGPHARIYPYSISYDVTTEGLKVEAEIGPDKDKPQGALGNLLQYGSSKNPPHDHLGPPLDAEAPRLEQYAATLGETELVQS